VLAALKEIARCGRSWYWGRYGFADAFNPQTGWIASDVIGIDVGIYASDDRKTCERFQFGQAFMHAPEVQRGLKLAASRRATDAADRHHDDRDHPFQLPATLFQFFVR